MLNQIHHLLTRRLVQKKEEPKAKQIQFSTGFPKIAAPGPLQVPGVCYPSFMTTKARTLARLFGRLTALFTVQTFTPTKYESGGDSRTLIFHLSCH